MVFCNPSPIASCGFDDESPAGLFGSIVPTLRAVSRDVGLGSTAVALAFAATAEGTLEMTCSASAPADAGVFLPPTVDFAPASGIEAASAGALFPHGANDGAVACAAGNS